eukprot:IDg6139t1
MFPHPKQNFQNSSLFPQALPNRAHHQQYLMQPLTRQHLSTSANETDRRQANSSVTSVASHPGTHLNFGYSQAGSTANRETLSGSVTSCLPQAPQKSGDRIKKAHLRKNSSRQKPTNITQQAASLYPSRPAGFSHHLRTLPLPDTYTSKAAQRHAAANVINSATSLGNSMPKARQRMQTLGSLYANALLVASKGFAEDSNISHLVNVTKEVMDELKAARKDSAQQASEIMKILTALTTTMRDKNICCSRNMENGYSTIRNETLEDDRFETAKNFIRAVIFGAFSPFDMSLTLDEINVDRDKNKIFLSSQLALGSFVREDQLRFLEARYTPKSKKAKFPNLPLNIQTKWKLSPFAKLDAETKSKAASHIRHLHSHLRSTTLNAAWYNASVAIRNRACEALSYHSFYVSTARPSTNIPLLRAWPLISIEEQHQTVMMSVTSFASVVTKVNHCLHRLIHKKTKARDKTSHLRPWMHVPSKSIMSSVAIRLENSFELVSSATIGVDFVDPEVDEHDYVFPTSENEEEDDDIVEDNLNFTGDIVQMSFAASEMRWSFHLMIGTLLTRVSPLLSYTASHKLNVLRYEYTAPPPRARYRNQAAGNVAGDRQV